MAVRLSEDERDQELRLVFDAFDSDKDGRVSVAELRESFETILDESLDDIYELTGIKQEPGASLSYEQFKSLMSSTK